jgi:hypothetical protein
VPAPTSDASSRACTLLSLSSPPTRHPGGPELPQTQPGEVELGSTVHNESHKCQKCNASLSCTDLDGASGDDSHKESGGQEGDDDQADEEEESIDSVLSTSGVDARPKVEVRGWDVLREQIKDDIVHAHKKHPRLTTINQLLLLCNFSTLRIKGVGRIAASQEIARQWHKGEGTHFARQVRILARHYQLFEQLPTRNVGGYRGFSIFNDEQVQSSAQNWLSRLLTGDVSPRHFSRALNKEILPCLGLNKTSISERTAQRWLVKLGWRQTRLKKGVYMDGHERDDVVKYRNKFFLPLITEHERCMVKWVEKENGQFEHIEPQLHPGEKRIIPIFQDESSFHAGEYKSNVW